MSNALKPGAVIFAKQVETLAAFYAEVLKLPVTHAAKDHVLIESEQLQLVIHAIPAAIARSITMAQPPVVREQTAIKPFFQVASLAEARMLAAQRGGALDPPAKEWSARGFRACDGHDPEGNVFQLRESVG